jgi:hypothetical protein
VGQEEQDSCGLFSLQLQLEVQVQHKHQSKQLREAILTHYWIKIFSGYLMVLKYYDAKEMKK